jgi:hypothetical protein
MISSATRNLYMSAFFVICALSTAQNFQWVKQEGSKSWEEAGGMTLDPVGNLYSIGYFQDTVDFDPGPGVFTLTALGMQDIFITKFDASGGFQWVKTVASSGWEEGHSITTDINGNIYLTGFFLGTTDFDPSVGVFTLTSSVSGDGFICKLNSTGSFVWARQFTGNLAVTLFDIAVDKSGNVLTTGFFDGTADLDPGPGTFSMTVVGYSDIFISKLDSSGNFVWAKRMGGGDGEVGYSICTDVNGNVYTTGTFFGTVDFDPGSGTFNLQSPGQQEIYACKLDSAGNFLWAKQIGGETGYSIELDKVGNVLVTGEYGWNDIMINKLSTSGTTIWSKQIGGFLSRSIAVDNNNSVYTTGQFMGIKDFDPGPATFTLAAGGSTDSYICKLDAFGSLVWVKQFKGSNEVQSRSIVVDASGNVFTNGFFDGTADFDPSSATYTLSALGSYDVFLHKLSPPPSTVALPESNFLDLARVYPNPMNGKLVVELHKERNDLTFVIRNSIGQVVTAEFFSEGSQKVIQVNDAAGFYTLEISDQNGCKTTIKFIKN